MDEKQSQLLLEVIGAMRSTQPMADNQEEKHGRVNMSRRKQLPYESVVVVSAVSTKYEVCLCYYGRRHPERGLHSAGLDIASVRSARQPVEI